LLDVSPTQTIKFDFANVDAQLRLATETINLLDIGYLILKSAAFRTESRGGHYRADYPQTSNDWQVHTLVKREDWWRSSQVQ
jgi:L-aspartate oxidase